MQVKIKDYEQGEASGTKKLLSNSKVDWVMNNISELSPPNPQTKKVLEYYQANKDRMDYGKYLQIGFGLIGWGIIESAYRTVAQKRLTLS